ncbi:peptidoglycan-binding protein [Streptomyces sp. NPDC007991]|uniref:peptidoglycan-binding domain-containing protein n=1 Tax=Streptomyces sp. NPDC007991 TaxID=3364803 RepID=UPI0036EA1FA2
MAVLRNKTALAAAALAASAVLAGGLPATTASAAPNVANISQGSGNRQGVWCVQFATSNWASRTGKADPISVDGVFGPATLALVKKFQRASGLAADGIVGKLTGNSILDNAGAMRDWCYPRVPSTRR